ncbi:uncharacterized protein KY384_005157 [Bacidia gigantensis]|uniref:uncharacterized protein n=1 Tax=Bacidia gigantensis TaxID=2732470 RepID=UPI001D039DDD|nr:uncharacterized protein KY384_005157 [Bacidia gigantensis]KAG8529676.1 hypothetical protein KY384_005157 [Bacidia gigantensis]
MSFDDRRIAHHPDKKLLELTRKYYKAFVTHDADTTRAMQAPGYTMTDIPLCAVRLDRDAWYALNKAFSKVGASEVVTALSLAGSSDPGHISVMEVITTFELAIDAPPGSEEKLPVGAKKGDTVTMVVNTTIFWGEGGKILKELEYGRLAWKDFDIGEWDRADQKERGAMRVLRSKL